MEIIASQSKVGPRPLKTLRLPETKDTPVADFPGHQLSDMVTISGALLAAGGTAAISLTDFSKIDKFKHMGITAAATVAFGSLGFSPAASATLAWVGGTVGKELIYDLILGRGTASIHDAVANLAGAFAGYAALRAAEGIRDREQTVPSVQSVQRDQAQNFLPSSFADIRDTSL